MSRVNTVLNWQHVILLLCLSLARGFAQKVIIDGGNSPHEETFNGLSIHTCPAGFAMMGANVGANSFLCIQVITSTDTVSLNQQVSQSVTEHSWQITDGNSSMLGCRNNMYMRGLHNGQNIIVCSNIPFSTQGTVFDNNGATQGTAYNFNGHICPHTSIMVGIQNSQNNFACAIPDASYAGFPNNAVKKTQKKIK